MEFDWLNISILVLMVIAIVNRIKKAIGEGRIKSDWYTLMAIGLGFGIYYFALYVPETIKIGLLIGLAASGIWDIRKGPS